MDHLPIPPQLRHRGIAVPRLRTGPTYDRLGFESFPSRVGYEVDNLPLQRSTDENVQNSRDLRSPSEIESFFQEWLWFGLMHEFEIACGVDNLVPYTTRKSGKEFLDTTHLVDYVRKAVITELLKYGVPLDLEVGDMVIFRKNPTSMSKIEPTRVASRDAVNQTYVIGDPQIWTGPLEYLAKVRDHAEKPLGIEACESAMASTSLNVLVQVLKKARNYYEDADSEARNYKTIKRLSRCLKKASKFSRRIVFYHKPILRFEVALSVSILCETVQHLIEQIWGCWITLDRNGTVFYDNKFREDMISNNWCPARIETLLVWTVSNQYCSSLLPSYDTISHRKCSSLSCIQKPSNPEHVKPQHWKPNCTCEIQSFDEADLIKVLEDGGNPGLLRTLDGSGNPSYSVIDVTNRDFVAISHVFTQGRGNSTANALPKCQLEMLFEAIHELDPKAALWIDTISVPIHPTFKRRAIAKLRDIYTISSRVLVVDRRLMQVGSHWMERRLQVLASEWMGRLWTLQEGRLASELYFRFKDEAVPATELINAQASEEQEDLASLTRCFAHTGKENRVYFEKQDSVIKKFLNLIEDLSSRSVTFPSDEPICIATLLGLKLEDFHPYPTMVDIYRSVEAIPSEVLFLSAPRINLPGFHWAPTTFLELDRRWFINTDTYTTELTPRGLVLTKDCIFFSGKVEIKKGNMYLVSDEDSGKSEHAFQRSTNSRASSSTKKLKNAAVIIERNGHGSSAGVLVSIASKDRNRTSSISSERRLLKSIADEGPIQCVFEMHLVVYAVNEHNTPEIERRQAVRGCESVDLRGISCRGVRFCVD